MPAIATAFRVSALDTAFVDEVRRTLTDRFGNSLTTHVDHEGGSPCRHCLQNAKPGDELIVLSYSPWAESHPYREVGPIFIHANPCPRYEESSFPPEMLARRTFALRAYNREDTIADASLATEADFEEKIDALFSNEEVVNVHVRNAAYGCYLFEVSLD